MTPSLPARAPAGIAPFAVEPWRSEPPRATRKEQDSPLKRAAIALVLAATVGVGHIPARAANVNILTTVAYRYLPGDTDEPQTSLRIPQGSSLLYANLDTLGNHNVHATETFPDGRPLFDSGEQISAGETAPVTGVESLTQGTYRFFCTVHGIDTMSGILEITPPQ